MELSTTHKIHGKHIVRQFGLVRGNTIRARHIGRDIMAIFRHIVGDLQGPVRAGVERFFDDGDLTATDRAQAVFDALVQPVDLAAAA